ncbi:MAG: tetratricopeptide repeat protein [candidate division NC10 bacterium]|nr:tetratricopeptide repeat protein [candidate division NC10 bacterium]
MSLPLLDDIKKLKSQGRYDEAIDLCRKALEACPDDIDLLYELGFSYLAGLLLKGEVGDQAVQVFQRIIELNPHDVKAYIALGTAYEHDLIDFEKASEAYRKAMEVDPRNPDGYIYLARLYGSPGVKISLDEKVRLLQKAQEDAPDHWMVLNEWGNHYREMEDYQSAKAYYEKALRSPGADADLVARNLRSLASFTAKADSPL